MATKTMLHGKENAFAFARRAIPAALAAGTLVGGALIAGCGGSDDDGGPLITQPTISAKAKPVLTVDGYQFKDLNGNGKLDPYEDWRLSVDARINDLVAQMTPEEKVGMMMINDNNAGCARCGDAYDARLHQQPEDDPLHPAQRRQATADPCDGSVTPRRGGFVVTPEQTGDVHQRGPGPGRVAAPRHPGALQGQRAQPLRHGSALRHLAGAGAFTEFPKEAGIAAAALGEQF